MPNYDYECVHCGHRFEAFQYINASPLEKCPKCHKRVKRLIGSGAGVIFKGSGFYATDYRKGSDKEKPSKGTCPKPNPGCDSCPHAK